MGKGDSLRYNFVFEEFGSVCLGFIFNHDDICRHGLLLK